MAFFVCVVLMSMGVVWSLRVCVRYVRARVPRCLRCLMFMLSGPTELLFLNCVMAFFLGSVNEYGGGLEFACVCEVCEGACS